MHVPVTVVVRFVGSVVICTAQASVHARIVFLWNFVSLQSRMGCNARDFTCTHAHTHAHTYTYMHTHTQNSCEILPCLSSTCTCITSKNGASREIIDFCDSMHVSIVTIIWDLKSPEVGRKVSWGRSPQDALYNVTCLVTCTCTCSANVHLYTCMFCCAVHRGGQLAELSPKFGDRDIMNPPEAVLHSAKIIKYASDRVK